MNTLNVSRKKILLFFASTIYFFFSVVILSHYDQGDRKVFQDIYNNIANSNIIDAINFFKLYLNTHEIGWVLINYPSSYLGINKIYLDSALATIFFYVILSFLFGYGKICLFIFLQFFINIQFLALVYSSQKLFLAFLFFSIFFMVKRKYSFLIFSFLSHSTILIYTVMSGFIYSIKPKLWIYRLFLFLLVAFIITILFGEYFFTRAKIYGLNYEYNTTNMFLKSIFLFVISLVFSKKNKINICNSFLFIGFCILIPNERSIQLFYFYTLYLVSISRQLITIPFLLALTSTSMYKGIFYIKGVFEIGNGLDPNNFKGVL